MKLSIAILSLALLSGGNCLLAQTAGQDKKAKAYMVADAHLVISVSDRPAVAGYG